MMCTLGTLGGRVYYVASCTSSVDVRIGAFGLPTPKGEPEFA